MGTTGLPPPYVDTFVFFGGAILLPSLWGYFCGGLKRHKIGLPLAFGPLILMSAPMIGVFLLSLRVVVFDPLRILWVYSLYSIIALIGYYIGYQRKSRQNEDRHPS